MDNKKINILYASSFSSLQGGGQRSLLLLLKYLDKTKFMPFVVMPEKGELFDEVSAMGIKCFVVPLPRLRSFNFFATIASINKLFKISRDNQIDIIHTDTPRQTLYAVIIKKFLNISVVLHLRVTDTVQWIDRLIYPFTDKLIAVSRAVACRFNFAPNYQHKVKVVYNAVDLEQYLIQEVQLQRPKLVIGYFGRIARRKGIDVLIKAANRISDQVKLIIIGSGDLDYLNELKSMSTKKNTDEVEFRDYQKNVIKEISDCDVIVLPSIQGEGLSRVIIEGMALGKVVLASDLPENREALGEYFDEFVFPQGDDQALSLMLEKLNKNREVLIVKRDILNQRVKEVFNAEINTKEIENIYQGLIDAGKN